MHVTWPRHFDVAGMQGQFTLQHGVQALLRNNPGWKVELSNDSEIESYLRERCVQPAIELRAGSHVAALRRHTIRTVPHHTLALHRRRRC